MFGKPKHTYTCPDHLYDRAVARRNAKISIIANLTFLGGLIGLGAWQAHKDKKMDEELKTMVETPTE